MAINFTLSDQRFEDPAESWNHRPWKGWISEVPAEEVWENNRGIWRFGDRVTEQRIATFSWQRKIVLVAVITGIEDVKLKFQTNGTRRRALQGHVLPAGHPVREALIGWDMPRQRVEFTYFDTTAQEAVLAAEEERAATAPSRQGHQLDPLRRKALEDAAQHRLETHYRDRGWDVTDVRFEGPYDAIAHRDGHTRYLEAKGTQSTGESVIVTAAEVAHARRHPGQCVIGVLSNLRFTDDGALDGSGAEFILHPWNPKDEDLQATEYRWDTTTTASLTALERGTR